MKFTNVKQLIIKFMGGGLINFPTRFLRWVKINGDIDDSDDGGSGGDDGDPIKEFIKKLTYGYCSNYTYDEETDLLIVEEPKDIPKIFVSTSGMGHTYTEDTDKINFCPGGQDNEFKITLNDSEINFSDLFNSDFLIYDAIIAGYSEVNYMKIPIILITLDKQSWIYSNSNIEAYMNRNDRRIEINNIISNIHMSEH